MRILYVTPELRGSSQGKGTWVIFPWVCIRGRGSDLTEEGVAVAHWVAEKCTSLSRPELIFSP